MVGQKNDKWPEFMPHQNLDWTYRNIHNIARFFCYIYRRFQGGIHQSIEGPNFIQVH